MSLTVRHFSTPRGMMSAGDTCAYKSNDPCCSCTCAGGLGVTRPPGAGFMLTSRIRTLGLAIQGSASTPFVRFPAVFRFALVGTLPPRSGEQGAAADALERGENS